MTKSPSQDARVAQNISLCASSVLLDQPALNASLMLSFSLTETASYAANRFKVVLVASTSISARNAAKATT